MRKERAEKKTDAVFEEIGIRHGRPYHPPSGRMGTVTVSYVTVDGWGFDPPIPSATDDGWGGWTTHTIRYG